MRISSPCPGDPPASADNQHTPSPTLLVRFRPRRAGRQGEWTIFFQGKARIKFLLCGPKFLFLGHSSLSRRILGLEETLERSSVISLPGLHLMTNSPSTRVLPLLGYYHQGEGPPLANHWQDIDTYVAYARAALMAEGRLERRWPSMWWYFVFYNHKSPKRIEESFGLLPLENSI